MSFAAAQAETAFRHALGPRAPETLPQDTGLAAMPDVHAGRRAGGVDPEADGDMQLFQWGSSHWRTGALEFSTDLTRQLILPGEDEGEGEEDDDNAIRQLRLARHHPPAARSEAQDNGNRWCRTPEELPAFRDRVLAAAGRAPQTVALSWECAG